MRMYKYCVKLLHLELVQTNFFIPFGLITVLFYLFVSLPQIYICYVDISLVWHKATEVEHSTNNNQEIQLTYHQYIAYTCAYH